MAEAPLSLTDGTSFEKKKKAEPVTRNNVLAWRQPFCTTSGGTDRHREALALSWHQPDPRLGVVTDSQAGACHAWRLSPLTSVRAISLPWSVASPRTRPWDLFLCCSTAPMSSFGSGSLCVVWRLSFTPSDLALWSHMTCKLTSRSWHIRIPWAAVTMCILIIPG